MMWQSVYDLILVGSLYVVFRILRDVWHAEPPARRPKPSKPSTPPHMTDIWRFGL